MSRAVVAMAVAVALAATACADGGPSGVAVEEEVRTPPPTSPGGVDRRVAATAGDPLRVVVVGDSIASELEAAVGAAIGRGPAASVVFVPSPALPRGDEVRRWGQMIRAADPDLVVVLVGVWERFSYGAARRAGVSRAQYLDRVAVPFVDASASGGAQIVFVGYRPQPASPEARLVADLQDGLATVAQAAFVAGDVDLRDGAGLATQVVGRGEGSPRRVRRTDGTHLCPDGAVEVAEAVLDHVAIRWEVPVADGWTDGAWRDRSPFDDPEECPAP